MHSHDVDTLNHMQRPRQRTTCGKNDASARRNKSGSDARAPKQRFNPRFRDYF